MLLMTTIVHTFRIVACFYLCGTLRCVRRDVRATNEARALNLAGDALRLSGADVLSLSAGPL